MKAIAFGALAALFISSAASSAIVMTTYEGTIDRGADTAGFLGTPGSDLAGRNYRAVVEIDTNINRVINSWTGHSDVVYGPDGAETFGPVIGGVSPFNPFVSAVLTIDGTDIALPSHGFASAGIVGGQSITHGSSVYAQPMWDFYAEGPGPLAPDPGIPHLLSTPFGLAPTYGIAEVAFGGGSWPFDHGNGTFDFNFTGNVTSVSSSLQEAPEPMTYGLFLGVRDVYGNGVELAGDLEALALLHQFEQFPNTRGLSLTNSSPFGGITPEQLAQSISDISSMMRPGDDFLLFASSHGSSDGAVNANPLTYGLGDEYLALGSGIANRIYDDYLASLLEGLPEADKLLILDACMSGGFWDSLLLDFDDDGDLDEVSRTALIATARENSLAYSIGADGYGLAYMSLLELWQSRSELPTANEMYNAMLTYPLRHLEFTPGLPVYERGAGDAVPYHPTLYAPTMSQSPDFAGAIPEPETWTLMVLAFACVGSALRYRRENSRVRVKHKPA